MIILKFDKNCFAKCTILFTLVVYRFCRVAFT